MIFLKTYAKIQHFERIYMRNLSVREKSELSSKVFDSLYENKTNYILRKINEILRILIAKILRK